MIDRSKMPFSKIVLIFVLVALAGRLGLALVHYAGLARPALAFPYQLDYGEGPLLDQTLRLAGGENIYRNNFSVPPYTISNYPPLFLALQVPFSLVFGPAFWYGRMISLLAALLTALFIGLTLFTLTRDWAAALVSGLVLLSFPYIQFWSLLNRIDLLALVLSWAGLFVVTRYTGRRWGIPAAAILLFAAIFTRQSYALAAPFAAFVWLLAGRQFRKAFQLALITGGVVIGIFLLLNLLSRGGFYMNIVTANVNPFNWDTVDWNFRQLYSNAFYLIFIAGLFAVAGWSKGNWGVWSLALPYLLAAAVSAVTIGKEGSNVNYLLELAAALSLCGGAALAWARKWEWAPVVLAAFLFVQAGLLLGWTRADFDSRLTNKFEQQAEFSELFRLVREADGIVLADENMGLIPLAGKRLYLQPFEFKQLADARIWDDREILKAVRSGQFDLILMYQPPDWPAVDSRWTPGLKNTVRRVYRLEDTIAYDWVFIPRR